MVTDVAVMSAKGQVTIPKSIREALGVKQSDRLLFQMEGDRLVVIPLRRRALHDLFNALPATRPYPGTEEVRAEIQRDLGERMQRGEA